MAILNIKLMEKYYHFYGIEERGRAFFIIEHTESLWTSHIRE